LLLLAFTLLRFCLCFCFCLRCCSSPSGPTRDLDPVSLNASARPPPWWLPAVDGSKDQWLLQVASASASGYC
jgi:hypothetical protein